MINSELNFTLEEILPKFPKDFQEKIKHSVELLRKAEKLALAYSPDEGFYLSFSMGKDSQCLELHTCNLGDMVPLSYRQDCRCEVQGSHGSHVC